MFIWVRNSIEWPLQKSKWNKPILRTSVLMWRRKKAGKNAWTERSERRKRRRKFGKETERKCLYFTLLLSSLLQGIRKKYIRTSAKEKQVLCNSRMIYSTDQPVSLFMTKEVFCALLSEEEYVNGTCGVSTFTVWMEWKKRHTIDDITGFGLKLTADFQS